MAIVDWSPLASIVTVVTIVVCATVFWLALANFKLLFRRQLVPGDMNAVRFRLAISRYILVFFAAVWFLVATVCLASTVSVCQEMEGGEAKKAILRVDTEQPLIMTQIMLVLVGVHCAVGILFEIRKRKVEK